MDPGSAGPVLFQLRTRRVHRHAQLVPGPEEPWYKVDSYEKNYEDGNIGTRLSFDQWRESQAYQAFGAWESMKMQLLMGTSGFSWCSLESGPNMFT